MNTIQKQQGSALLGVIIIVVVALLGILGYILWQSVNSNGTAEPQSTEQTTDKNMIEEDDEVNGVVAGKAIYPSDGYPEGFKVCVVTKDDRTEVICDTTFTENGYSVEVSPGEYYVVAKAPLDEGVFEGYYDGYMKSGMTSELCETDMHTPILITVASGATLQDIDAGNFYYVEENCQ